MQVWSIEKVSYSTTGSIIGEKLITAVIRCAVPPTFISPFSSRSERNGIDESSISVAAVIGWFLICNHATWREEGEQFDALGKSAWKKNTTRKVFKTILVLAIYVGNELNSYYEFKALTFMLIARQQSTLSYPRFVSFTSVPAAIFTYQLLRVVHEATNGRNPTTVTPRLFS